MAKEDTEKILAMAQKYGDYFKEWNADIALGRKGPHFFYLYDEKYECFEVFHSFETAEQLELLILGTLAEELECMNSVCTEELHFGFRDIDINERFDEYEPKFHMHILEKQLEVMAEQSGAWMEMMAKTYKALHNIIEEMES